MRFYGTNPERKFGRDHWPGCNCEDCNGAYLAHNAHKYCTCHSCEMHRRNVDIRLRDNTPGRKKKVASINICSRPQCGAMATSTAMTRVYIAVGELTIDDEICPGCTSEMMQWWRYAPAVDRERAYREPYSDPKDDTGTGGINPKDLLGLMSAAFTEVMARHPELTSGSTTIEGGKDASERAEEE